MARYIRGRWVTPKTTPAWWASGAYGTPRKKWEPGHWVDASGRWVAAPGKKGGTGTIERGPGTLTPPPKDPFKDLEDRAHAYAAAQLAKQQAAIERARAAAMAQAQRDADTYSALGQAQMGMISQIPAKIQEHRNLAGQAIAGYGNQLSGGTMNRLLGERAAAATFEASQTGMAPTSPELTAALPPAALPVAPPPSPDGAAPAPEGAPAPAPGPGPVPTPTAAPGITLGPGPAAPEPGKAIGLNAQAAMAASAQMGGVIPGRQQAEIGAASAMAAEGMPAVVARATQDQVAMRMSQAATEDADYRQQLIDLAATEGGVYEDALSNLYDIEAKKQGLTQAEDNRKLDWEKFNESKREWEAEMRMKKFAMLDAQVQAGLKSRAQAAKEKRDYDLARRRVEVQEGGLEIRKNAPTAAETAAAKAKQPNSTWSKTNGYVSDGNGRAILKNGKKQYLPGFKAGPHGTTVKTGKGSGGGAPSGGVAKANEMARNFRGEPDKIGYDKNGKKVLVPSRPKASYQSAYTQILNELLDRGYGQKDAQRLARSAVNTAYGPGVGGRPGVRRKA